MGKRYSIKMAEKLADLGFELSQVVADDQILLYNPDIEVNSDIYVKHLLNDRKAFVLEKESDDAPDQYELVIMANDGKVELPTEAKVYLDEDVDASKLFDLNCYSTKATMEALKGRLETYSKVNSNLDYTEFMSKLDDVKLDSELKELQANNEELFPITLMTEDGDYGVKEIVEELDKDLGKTEDPVPETVDPAAARIAELEELNEKLAIRLEQINERLLTLINLIDPSMLASTETDKTSIPDVVEVNPVDYANALKSAATTKVDVEFQD